MGKRPDYAVERNAKFPLEIPDISATYGILSHFAHMPPTPETKLPRLVEKQVSDEIDKKISDKASKWLKIIGIPNILVLLGLGFGIPKWTKLETTKKVNEILERDKDALQKLVDRRQILERNVQELEDKAAEVTKKWVELLSAGASLQTSFNSLQTEADNIHKVFASASQEPNGIKNILSAVSSLPEGDTKKLIEVFGSLVASNKELQSQGASSTEKLKSLEKEINESSVRLIQLYLYTDKIDRTARALAKSSRDPNVELKKTEQIERKGKTDAIFNVLRARPELQREE